MSSIRSFTKIRESKDHNYKGANVLVSIGVGFLPVHRKTRVDEVFFQNFAGMCRIVHLHIRALAIVRTIDLIHIGAIARFYWVLRTWMTVSSVVLLTLSLSHRGTGDVLLAS